MNLPQGSRSQRLRIKRGKDMLQGTLQLKLYPLFDELEINRGDSVLQEGKSVSIFYRQDIDPGRDELPDFNQTTL
ncbi:MAG: hypothetical protein AB1797_10470 [bacterium]